MNTGALQPSPLRVGRYTMFDEIAAGGMATVHLGTLSGSGTFARTVAIKRLHPQFSKDPEFVSMFLDEARIASRIRHPNIVSTLDVVAEGSELFLVMEYIHGESVSGIQRILRQQGRAIDPPVAVALMVGVLLGLHAAHDAANEHGEPLHIVHRDISPQNILVGVDGVARVVDFGVAKATGRLQTTREGQIKGKAAYMAPEQLTGDDVDRRVDIYASSVVLWEMLVGKRLFMAESPARSMALVLGMTIEPPSAKRPGSPPVLDDIVLKGLSRDPRLRFATAREMAVVLQKAMVPAASTEVGDWVEAVAGDELRARAALIARIERAGIETRGVSASMSKPTPPRAADGDDGTRRDVIAASSGPSALHSRETTGISGVSSGIGARSRRARAAGIAAGAAVVFAGGAIAVGLRLSGARPALAVASASPEPSAAREPADAAPAAPSSAPAPAPSGSSPSANLPAPSRSAPTTRPARPETQKAAPLPAMQRSARAGCSPPYTIDAKGIHIPKPECF